MRQIRFGKLIALACMGLAVACTSGTDGGTAGNTEINLSIVNPGVGLVNTSEELGFATDRVDYRITCAGNDPGTYPIPPSSTGGDYIYDDSADFSGSFEIIDTRVPPVWNVRRTIETVAILSRAKDVIGRHAACGANGEIIHTHELADKRADGLGLRRELQPVVEARAPSKLYPAVVWQRAAAPGPFDHTESESKGPASCRRPMARGRAWP